MLYTTTYTDYALDIVLTLKHKENQRIPFNFQSPELHYRQPLTHWIQCMSAKLKLSTTSVHLAVYLLDTFMDHHAIAVERLNLVPIVCLLLATKIEENDADIPKISDFNCLTVNQYIKSDLIALEFMILEFMGWNLIVPTAAHFIEYYDIFAVTTSDLDDVDCKQFESFHQLKKTSRQCINDYLDKSMTELKMYNFQPSVVAASCIAATRQFLHLVPTWSIELWSITEYKLHDLRSCTNILMGIKSSSIHGCKRKLPKSPDHGYESGNSFTNSPENVAKKRSCHGRKN